MQRLINNLLYSKAPLMVVLRYLLIILLIIMALMRLRIILALLTVPESYLDRDSMTYYLMARAFLSGLNPYLPINELALKFVGVASDLTHPAPCTPMTILLFLPLSFLRLGNYIFVWYLIEMLFLGAIAYMLSILWSGKHNLIVTCFIFIIMIAWYPVMVDLLYGQLTILLSALILAALLALHKDKKILAGVLIGCSMAIKMYTWPVILYFAIKKDWRTFISSCLTFILTNLFSAMVIGINPVMDYYFRVTAQVSAIYHSFLQNYSIWSIGYRFFEGTHPIGGDFVSAPPLVSVPELAPITSAGFAVAYLVLGLVWAKQSTDLDIAYSIMICVLIAISPITWDHYYLMLIIPVVILLKNLSNHDFPVWSTIIFLFILFMLLFFNERIADVIFGLNDKELLQVNGNRISFGSSLLEIFPMIELVILSILLWRTGIQKKSVTHSSAANTALNQNHN